MIRFLSALAASLLVAAPAFAADGPLGIGFAQAEEGTWWCPGTDSRKALDCAISKCKAAASGQDCHATRWCMPAGWSGLMVTWLPEFHSTHVLCGMPGQAAAGDALKAICDAGVDFSRCDVVLFVDPDGGEHEVSDMSWPGPMTR